MRTLAEKEDTRRTLQVLAVMGWGISSMCVFFLLIAIPREYVLNPPIQCEIYAFARRGWGCARFGDAASHPIIFWVSVALSIICAAFSFEANQFDTPPRALVMIPLHLAFMGIAIGSVRFVYYFQGHVTADHAWATATGVVFSCATLSLPYLVWRMKR